MLPAQLTHAIVEAGKGEGEHALGEVPLLYDARCPGGGAAVYLRLWCSWLWPTTLEDCESGDGDAPEGVSAATLRPLRTDLVTVSVTVCGRTVSGTAWVGAEVGRLTAVDKQCSWSRVERS